MAVRLARRAGFCMGVRRALNLTLDSAFGGKRRARRGERHIRTLGPLIHNPQVVALLREYGVEQIDSPKDAGDGAVIVRAHGIPPAVRRELRESDNDIIDATCPRVARVQSIVKRKAAAGALVLIAGDAGHAEVMGLEGYANGRSRVLKDADEVARVDTGSMDWFDEKNVCLVAQTTHNREKYRAIADTVCRRWSSTEVFDTLCSSTDERQSEVVTLAEWADAFVVVGGRVSANTARLVDVARETGRPTFHVETADGLDQSELASFKNVGVTAGASTPNWLIQDVVDRLHVIQAGGPGLFSLTRRLGRLAMQLITDMGILVSAGAGCMTYASCKLQGIPGRTSLYLLSAMYVFAMVMFSNLSSHVAMTYSEPRRGRFYEKYRVPLILAAVSGAAGAAVLALWAGWLPFAVTLVATCLGISYVIPEFPKWMTGPFRHFHMRDLPASKDVAAAAGWAAVCALVPFLAQGSRLTVATFVSILFVSVIVFIRSVLVAVRRIQGDRLVGIETIPTAVGIAATKVILAVIAAGLALTLWISSAVGWTPDVGYGLISCVMYACIYLYLYHERIIFQGLPFEAVVDGNFILAGLIAAMMG